MSGVPQIDGVRTPDVPGPIDWVERNLVAAGAEVAPVGTGESTQNIPVRHFFTPGLYAREVTMPKGLVLTSKIHKTEHPYVVSRGRCAVLIEGTRWEMVRAPHFGVTLPGTRRLLAILDETVWTTFHPTDKTDLAEIERDLIVEYENPLLAEGGGK